MENRCLRNYFRIAIKQRNSQHNRVDQSPNIDMHIGYQSLHYGYWLIPLCFTILCHMHDVMRIRQGDDVFQDMRFNDS